MKKPKKLFKTVGTQMHVWDSALKAPTLFNLYAIIYVCTNRFSSKF